ncbi:hypothetical protein DL95DRAFT_59230 [Leptodontidium sp. 2 PMI_412]|nr:hypothetical protein DL95DRAFT_59230 [Leptodontidium sp. 2 PMI_412]
MRLRAQNQLFSLLSMYHPFTHSLAVWLQCEIYAIWKAPEKNNKIKKGTIIYTMTRFRLLPSLLSSLEWKEECHTALRCSSLKGVPQGTPLSLEMVSNKASNEFHPIPSCNPSSRAPISHLASLNQIPL